MPDREELEKYLEDVVYECTWLGFTEEETERMKEMETSKFYGDEDRDVD